MGMNTMPDGDGRDELRQGNLLCTVENRGLDRFALLEVCIDTFNGHRCVVHQNPDRQRKPAQRHDVDGLTQRRQTHDRARIDSGMETKMMTVLRQLARKAEPSIPSAPPQWPLPAPTPGEG